MIGKTISHYRVLEKLGSGGMGDVYKAEDTKLQRPVALKFLPTEMTRDEESRKRFIQEARAASALDHPNIGSIYEIDESKGHFYIAMAYYGGKTLKEKMESQEAPMRIEEAIDITIQIASGLDRAHSKNIIHRDIKPANIMVADDGQIKIIDFGLAKLKGRTMLTKTGTTMGTVAYMSPEQTQGSEIDQRSDIWSLGVILYQMLAGEQPFKGDYEQAIMYSILNEKQEYITKIRADLPVQIESILDKVLAKNPEKRYQTMSAFLEALNQAADEIKQGLSKSAFIFRLGRKQRRLVYRVGSLALILAVIGIYFWQIQLAEAKPVSILLLPLQDISQDTDQEWFTEGITEALITDLAKISQLRMISRNSAMQYKDTKKAPPEIADELGINYLIEGTVVKMGSRVKITARLINAEDDEYLWAEEYERDFSNILGLQGEIAQAIAEQVQIKLTPEEESLFEETRKVNPETYEAYLRGMYYLNRFEFDKGMTFLNQAIENDPGDPLAYAGLAHGYVTIGHSGMDPNPDVWIKAKAASLRALSLDAALAEGHSALATVQTYYEWDWKNAEQSYLRANELNPGMAINHYHYAWYLALFGRMDEAIREHELAQELDPLTSLYTTYLGALYWMERDYEKAIKEVENGFEIDPENWGGLWVLGFVLSDQGKHEEAIATHLKTGDPGSIGYSYAMAGNIEAARKQLAELEKQEASPWGAFSKAILYAVLGEQDQALESLAYSPHHAYVPWVRVLPFFKPLRKHPGYKDLLKKLNLPG